ncbi:MAG: CvpA family protein [Chloroflexi bacterium]|nr:CvpA family protein [Chloroflexota bacterium]
MNWIDAMIIVIVAVSTFSSLRAGFLRQASALIGFVVGVYAALGYHETVAPSLRAYIGDYTIAKIVAFVLILIAVWVISAFLATLASEFLKAIGLAWADHFLGMLMGLLIGLLVAISLLLLFAHLSIPGISEALRQSTLAPFIFQWLPHLRQLLPSDLHLFKVL